MSTNFNSRIVILPYGPSSGARDLAAELGAIRIRARNSTYVPRLGDLIVNWGSTRLPDWWNVRAASQTLNKPQYVVNAIDKISCFEILRAAGVGIVDFTRNRAVASAWLASPKYGQNLNAVVCRTLTRASGGRGIVLARTPEEIVNAPLYTRYTPKVVEYRIHVFREIGVIDAQQKRRRNGATDEGNNKYIRNHDNGWVFAREGVSPPKEVKTAAESAILALKLDFGAVDIGYHPEFGTFVYEVNTAPGLEGTTLKNYADAIRKLKK